MQTDPNIEHPARIFKQEKFRIMVRLLVISTIFVFGLETLLMYLLEYFIYLPQPYDWALDGIILAACIFPLNYYLVFRPMENRIDEHYRTNLELLKSNEILERFFSVSGVLIAYMDAKFNFIRVNEAYASTDERSAADFIGKNHFTLFPNAENQEIFETVVRTGNPYFVNEKPFQYAEHPERGVSYWDWSLVPVKNLNGQVEGLILFLTNVTERKQAQLALAESERRFRAVFNQTFQHMGLLDPAGNTLLFNQTALNFSGLLACDVAGKPFWQLPWWVPAADLLQNPADPLETAFQHAARGEVVRGELKVKPSVGEEAIMDFTLKPLLDDQGRTSLIIYEARDITQRILAEQAQLESEKEINRLYLAEMHAHQRAETLRSSAQALSGSLNSNMVLETLLDYISRVAPFNSAHILLLEDEDHLETRLALGEEDWEADQRLLGKRFIADEYPCFYKMLVERESLAIQDIVSDSRSFLFNNNPYVRSWLGIPLKAGEQVIGVSLLEHISPDFFTEDLAQWAIALTGQASVAIHNAWLFEQVRDNREHLQALSRRLVEAQEYERHYIARELHDEAGQALTSLMIGLHHLESDSGDQEAVMEHCQELKAITDGVIENLHRIAVNLRPATLDHLGLVAALRQHAEAISLQHGLKVQFETIGKIERMPVEMETAIYRIVQESLTNVVRHAHADRVDILLERHDHNLIVVVEDNGIGFDPQAHKINQLGVLGMRERADMLGGKITIESSPEQGSTIVLEVPCPSEL